MSVFYFSDDFCFRYEIVLALESIVKKPSIALSLLTPKRFSNPLESSVSIDDERRFLSERQFQVLNPRTILKRGCSFVKDVVSFTSADVKHVHGKPVYTIGDPSIASLRSLLVQFRQDHPLPNKVIVRDIREELVIYIKGIPYTRRDLECPVSALYHAGISAEDLERMEETLRNDVLQEAELHSGTVLLHQEVILDETEDIEGEDDITHNVTKQKLSVVPSWVTVQYRESVDEGLLTPKQVYEALKEEGYDIEFERVPLSRGRTPKASDLDQLGSGKADPQNAIHLVVSRSATGSSARFSAAFLTLLHPPCPRNRRSLTDHSYSKFALGEYRVVMHLCRVLPNGFECKAAVDAAIDACIHIGRLREDILSCIHAADSDPQTHQLGLHYLERYFFLIAYRCFMDSHEEESFSAWVSNRKELSYLLSSINLE